MYKFTAEHVRNITAVNIEKIKSESVESWLSCVFEMIEIAAQKTKEELVLSGYFWIHKSPERSKVFEILRENGFKIFSVNISKNVYGFDEPKIVISWKDIS